MERQWKSGVRQAKFESRGIENRILTGAVSRRNRSNPQALVKQVQDGGGLRARLVNRTQCAHRESCVHGRGQPFARHIAYINSELPVGQAKIIEEIAAHFAECAQKIGNFEIRAQERFPREKRFLNQTGFAGDEFGQV